MTETGRTASIIKITLLNPGEAYQNRLYPNGSFNIGQQICPEEPSDVELPDLWI